MSASSERILFVTGKLAEPLVRRTVSEVSQAAGFNAEVQVVGISVAALMHARWLQRKLVINEVFDRVVLPGWCQGSLDDLEKAFGVRFELGPKDILDLDEHFGQRRRKPVDLSRYDIEILAEINHAPRLSREELLRIARGYRDSGADVIDLGCIPGETWGDIGSGVRALQDEGLRVSVDSFDRAEVESAVAAGAELVLSVNSSNLDWALELDAEWVAIPDVPTEPEVLEGLAQQLAEAGRRFRADPILEPVGFGFARSLARYFSARREHPEWPLMMGVGNVTELSEVDSAGMNFLLAAICQELSIGSVLTTEVANWARSSVREFDLARRLVRHAIESQRLVKHIDSPLLVLRDEKLHPLGQEALDALSRQLTDPNLRIFVERGELHVMNREGYWRGDDPFELFDRFSKETSIDASHAFYLGFELCKAVTALRLGKRYRQDESLQWGYLTWSERSAHERRRQEKKSGERGE